METTPPDPELYLAPGEPIEVPDLTLTKAAALAAVASDEAFPFIDLAECRRDGTDEVVVVDVRPEVPQVPAYDVRHSERVAVVFNADDERQPNPLALRTSFPFVPHVNVNPEGVPRSLCLFETSYADQKLTWTAAGFARQLHHRLSATACGEVHDEDQPLEQLFLGSLARIVLPPEIFDPSTTELALDLAVYGTARTLEQSVLVAVKDGELPPGAASIPCVVTTYTTEPRTHGLIRLQPRTLSELVDFLGDDGPRFTDALRTEFDALGDDRSALDRNLIIIVRFPKRRTDEADPESIGTWAFITPRSVSEVGVDIGHWDAPAETDGRPGRLLVRDATKTGADTPLDLLNPTPALTRDAAALYNGTTPDDTLYVAVGAGALGSHVIPTLARAGHGRWTVVDSDHFLPHNAARHYLTRGAVGFPKADLLSYVLNDLYVEDVADSEVVNVLRGHPDSLADAFGEAGVVLDLSASVAVARHLCLDVQSGARRLSLFLSPSGTDLVLLAEPADRSIRLDLVEMEYYRALVRDALLAYHLETPGIPIRYAHACRDVSARLPHDLAMLHGAIGARAVRRLDVTPEARIWRASPDLSVTSVHVPIGQYAETQVNGWTVSISQRVLFDAFQQRVERLPNETGGVFLGAFDTSRQRIYVADHIAAPPDSVERPTSYIRGVTGLAERVDEVRAATAGQLGYVGEWHSHPLGAALDPSDDDRALFAWLTDHRRFDGLPAVMAIFGDGQSSWTVGDIDERVIL